MRLFVLASLLVGCVEIADPVFDNPCDPAGGGACADAETAPPVPDASFVDLGSDGGRQVVEADSAPDMRPPPPDMDRADADPRGTGACEPSGFTQNVFDCPQRIEGYCAYEFNVAPDFLSCDSFCEQIGRRCLRAWFADSEFYCHPVQVDACESRVQEMLCGCSAR